MKISIFLYIFIFIAENLSSQIDTVHLNKLVVKSHSKTLSKVFSDQIDSSYIQKNRSLQLSNLLKSQSDIYIKSYGNYGISTASFRGTAATHTQVFWNDVPMNSAMLGQTDFSTIPVAFTDKISLSEGLNSLPFSVGALGGLISLKSSISNKAFRINAFQTFASFGNYVSSVNIEKKIKNFSFNIRAQYSNGKNNFKYLNTALPGRIYQYLNNADFSQKSFLIQTRYIFSSKISTKQFLWVGNLDRNIPPIMTFDGLHRTENQKQKRLIWGLNFLFNNKNFLFKNTFAIKFDNLLYFLADSVYFIPKNFLLIKSNSFSNEHTYVNLMQFDCYPGEKFFVKFRINTQLSAVNTFDSVIYKMSGYKKSRFLNQFTSIFLYNLPNAELLTFTLSEIVSDKKLYIPAFSFTIKNITLDNQKRTKISFICGKNIHLPTLNDMYWLPGGNPKLKPEKSYSAQSSFLYKFKLNKKLLIKIKNTVFASFINDWIMWKPTQFHYWTPQNVKKVFSRGVSSHLLINYSSKINAKFYLNYSYTKTTNLQSYSDDDKSVGKQLIYIPVNLINFSLFLNYKKLFLDIDYSFVDKRYTSTSNYSEFVLLPYSLVDLSASKVFIFKNLQIKFSLGINNLLNKQYQVVLYRPMPGRNYSFSINLKLEK